MLISQIKTVNVYQCSVGPRSHPISGPCAAKALATLPGRSSWPRPGPALLGHRMIPWESQIASFAAGWKSRFPGDPMGGTPIETYWNLHLRYLWRTSSTGVNLNRLSYLEANRASNLRLSERFISYPAACWVLKFTFKNGGSGRLQEDSHHIHIILPDRTVPPWISMISRVTNTLAPFWQRVCREKHPVAQILKAPDASFPN